MKLIKTPAKNGLGKTQGTEKAPDRIVKSLEKYYLNERGIKPDFEIEKIPVTENIEQNNQNIYDYVSNSSEIPILIGGDHSITYPAFKAFSENFENPGIVVFDAHPDLVNNFKPPTHEDYLRVIVEELGIRNVVLVGLRNWDKTEYKYLKQKNIRYFSMREIAMEGKGEVCDAVMSIARRFGAVYISIDIDVIDPAFAPGTGYPEPGGMTSRELLYFIHRMQNLKNIQAYDLVEVNPDKDINNQTVLLGAKIVSELIQKYSVIPKVVYIPKLVYNLNSFHTSNGVL